MFVDEHVRRLSKLSELWRGSWCPINIGSSLILLILSRILCHYLTSLWLFFMIDRYIQIYLMDIHIYMLCLCLYSLFGCLFYSELLSKCCLWFDECLMCDIKTGWRHMETYLCTYICICCIDGGVYVCVDCLPSDCGALTLRTFRFSQALFTLRSLSSAA